MPPDTHQVVLDYKRHLRRAERLVYRVQMSEIAPDTLFFDVGELPRGAFSRVLRLIKTGSIRGYGFGQPDVRRCNGPAIFVGGRM